MQFTALTCPQCGAPLPRQAAWRLLPCPHCGANVTRSKSVVEAAEFRAAHARVWGRAFAADDASGRLLHCGERRFRLLAPLGCGENAAVYLAERISPLPERVTLKLAHAATPGGVLATEASKLNTLQQSRATGAAYFTRRLPQSLGTTQCGDREVLLLRHPGGYWGSLADVLRHAPRGIDPRHGVWLWRRILEVLAFVHDSGWSHGDLAPEHLLVHPRDHGVLIIGWGKARASAAPAAIARDLMQSAWSMRALLCGGDEVPNFSSAIPVPLANLLRRCSEDADWCAGTGARGVDQQLAGAAREAFGPPRFIPFNPTAPWRHKS